MTGDLLASHPAPGRKSGALPGIAISLVVNAVCPYLIYRFLTTDTTLSEVAVLLATGVPSILSSLVSTIRQRRMDFLAGAALFTTIATAIVVLALGGSPKLYLARKSFLTAAYGVALFVSLLFPKPLGYYAARYLFAGNSPEKAAGFDGLWQHKFFRHFIRVQTVAWGIDSLVEASLHIYLILHLSIPQYLIASHIVSYTCTGAILLWAGLYVKAWRARHRSVLEALQAQSMKFEGNKGMPESA